MNGNTITLSDLCLVEDNFLEDKTIWIVELSDGTRVYQDDNRPGSKIGCAWTRLGLFLSKSPLLINKMWLKFRDHAIEMPSNCIGYYFAKGIGRGVNSGGSHHYYTVGVRLHNNDTKIRCVKFDIPSLEPLPSIDYNISEVSAPFYIANTTKS